MVVLQLITAAILLTLIGAVALGCEKTHKRFVANDTAKVSHDMQRLGRVYLNNQKVERIQPDRDYSGAIDQDLEVA